MAISCMGQTGGGRWARVRAGRDRLSSLAHQMST